MRTITRSILPATILAVLASFATPSSAQVIFAEDFEDGADGWTLEGWREVSSQDCGPTDWPIGTAGVHFGHESCSYFSGAGGLTTVDAIAIPDTTQDVVLRFWSYDATECQDCGWDWRFVYVSTDGGANWTHVGNSQAYYEWYESTIDLSAYRGEEILLRFHFDEVDEQWNDFLGWIIDDVRIEYACPEPMNYCTSTPNSSGQAATISASGSTSVAANDFHLSVAGAPPGQLGIFFAGAATTATPFGNGTLCVAPGDDGFADLNWHGIFRILPATTIDANGELTRWIDWNQLPSGADVSPGESRFFQFWFRDPTVGFNLSDGLRVWFCP